MGEAVSGPLPGPKGGGLCGQGRVLKQSCSPGATGDGWEVGPLVNAEQGKGRSLPKREAVRGEVHSGGLGGRLTKRRWCPRDTRPDSVSGAGRAGVGVEAGEGLLPKCADARTSVRQDGHLQGRATELCLAYSFFKFNPNS